MKSKEFVVAGATLTLVTYVLALSVAGEALSAFQPGRKISNAGTVKGIRVGVYQDNDCTSVLDFIDWGPLAPGEIKKATCYVQNEWNSVSTLSFYTSSWSPSNASDHMSLTWDYSGQPINPDEAVQVTFTLSVSPNITGITDFSFNIKIVGSD